MKKTRLFTLIILIASKLSSQTIPIDDNKTVRLYNEGTNIHVGHIAPNSSATIFIKGAIKVKGNTQIEQVGKILLTGDFVNDTNPNQHIFTDNSTGLFEFNNQNSFPQTIHGSANKALSFINFPNVEINNAGAVTLVSSMGMSTSNINLTKGRLILASKAQSENNLRVDNAHLLVKGDIYYSRNKTPIEESGYIQVDLDLADNHAAGRIVGFSSPYQKLYSDYFFFNILSDKLSNYSNNIGQSTLIESPQYSLIPGKGYRVGLGIADDPTYWSNAHNQTYANADYSKRATTGFSFGREFGESSFTQYISSSDRFSGEKLNTENVKVPLEFGWNSLGNPFTAPLDISDLLDEVSIPDDWGITRGLTNNKDISSKIYILSQSKANYNPTSNQTSSSNFEFETSYLLAQKVGSTIELEDNGTVEKLLIAPMQMFVIGVYKSGIGKEITLPRNKQTHGNSPLFRSSNSEKTSTTDEILIEVKDQKTEGFDRLTVVFRDNASLAATDQYDAPKLFNDSRTVSQIYTPSADGMKMTANVISTETDELELHLVPIKKKQEVSLSIHRLASLTSISKVVLEDKMTNKKTQLTQDLPYVFISDPTDRSDRFVLHFIKDSGANTNNKILATNE